MDALCAGCCGSGMCWVCLGTGELEMTAGVRVTCHKCEGSTHCHVCGGEMAPIRLYGSGRGSSTRAG